MKRLLSVATSLIVALLLTTSCEKPIQKEDVAQEVQFSFELITEISKKDGSEIVEGLEIVCDETAQPAKVLTTIGGVDYEINLLTNFEDGRQTEVIKLPAGTHEISKFLVVDATGKVLYATPEVGSKYQQAFGMQGVSFDLVVEPFKKSKVEVPVLCYTETQYEQFGFTWFQYEPIAIKTVCFFGDVCTKFYNYWHSDLEGNVYAQQPYDGYDFPAIFRVEVDYGGGVIASFDNIEQLGEAPVCVEYPDNLLIEGETFTAKIFLQIPDGSEHLLGEVVFDDTAHSGEGSDWGGEDGVYEFSIGDCGNLEVEKRFPLTWMPLPESAVMTVLQDNPLLRGEPSYVDIKFTDVVGVDFTEIRSEEIIDGWCVAKNWNISLNTPYPIKFYSSLNPAEMPSYLSQVNFNALNWLANNIDLMRAEFTVEEIQDAIWHFTDGLGSNDAATRMSSESVDYIVPLGGYAFVILDPNLLGKQTIQIMAVKVDP